ncbi:MAG: 3-deoxy-manno-octulosonate cytidylyltransferase [Phycisphaerales bacterium]|jgi:3-deoxy-manno-octulosonate cytidylyltransferase (CMP-KDO synthetase)
MTTPPAGGERVVAVVPARWGSTRFPGKALAPLHGTPIIVHALRRASEARRVERVIAAVDDERIAKAAREAGFEAVMTRADHPNGTSRIAEVAARLHCEMVVNVQGDEPRIEPALIDLAVEALDHAGREVPVSTVASPFMPGEEPANPNIVKVVVGANGRALYFSRSLVPCNRDNAPDAVAPLKHVGLYVYRRPFLPTFVLMPATPLERTEQLEQLRVLENGYGIAVAIGQARFHGVDTPEQLERLAGM